jgi:uncharacterized membrane protein YphA (DoxX/SURF4 family)
MLNIINNIENKTVIVSLLVLMFVVSGISKIFTFDTVVENLKQKMLYNIASEFYKLVIVMVILVEIIAPIVIIYYSITGNNKREAYYSVISLCIFTVLATLIYHLPDIKNYKKSIAFWANMSLLGGLFLLAKTIKNNSI